MSKQLLYGCNPIVGLSPGLTMGVVAVFGVCIKLQSHSRAFSWSDIKLFEHIRRSGKLQSHSRAFSWSDQYGSLQVESDSGGCNPIVGLSPGLTFRRSRTSNRYQSCNPIVGLSPGLTLDMI